MEVWGTGAPLREFIYADDVARLTESAIDNYNEAEPIIFSTSEEVAIRDLVAMITELLQFKGKVIWRSDRPDGQLRKPSSIDKLRGYLPDFQFTPLYEGLKNTIAWFEEQYPNIRR